MFTADAEWLAPPKNATAMALDGTSHLIGRDRIVHFLTREFGTVFVDDVAIDFCGMFADEPAETLPGSGPPDGPSATLRRRREAEGFHHFRHQL